VSYLKKIANGMHSKAGGCLSDWQLADTRLVFGNANYGALCKHIGLMLKNTEQVEIDICRPEIS
jgi:hypothetical protein